MQLTLNNFLFYNTERNVNFSFLKETEGVWLVNAFQEGWESKAGKKRETGGKK